MPPLPTLPSRPATLAIETKDPTLGTTETREPTFATTTVKPTTTEKFGTTEKVSTTEGVSTTEKVGTTEKPTHETIGISEPTYAGATGAEQVEKTEKRVILGMHFVNVYKILYLFFTR